MHEDQRSPNYALILSVKWYKKQMEYDHHIIPNNFCIGYYCIFGMGKRKIEGSTEPNKNLGYHHLASRHPNLPAY